MQRVLFCSGNRLIAYDWAGGRFGNAACFTPDEDGYRAFEDYLRESPKLPVTMLIDLIEEEFHADTVPFVRGRDRKAVLDRSLQKYFRTSELRTVCQQGRERGGRKDLKICVAGLGNSVIIKRWLESIERNRISLRGVVSLPLIGERILPLIKADKQRVLLVSQQSPETLRQSFYDRGHLKLSRLAHKRVELPNEGSDNRHMLADIRNTLLFLKSQRLLHRSEVLDVCLIGKRESFAELEAELATDESLHCRVIDQAELAAQVGVRGELPTNYADGVFAHLLCKTRKLYNHYAPWRVRRFYAHHLVRRGLSWAAVLALVVGAGLSGSNYYDASLYDSYSQQIQFQTRRYKEETAKQQQQGESSTLPPLDVMKSTVNLIGMFEQRAAISPLGMMSELSEYLNAHPHIEITGLQWLTSHTVDVLPSLRAVISRAEMAARLERQQNRNDENEEYEIARLDGRVIGFGDNYGEAVKLFHRFVTAVRKSGLYDGLMIEKTPFDMNPEAEVSGDSGTSANNELRSQATFSLLFNRKRVSGNES